MLATPTFFIDIIRIQFDKHDIRKSFKQLFYQLKHDVNGKHSNLDTKFNFLD